LISYCTDNKIVTQTCPVLACYYDSTSVDHVALYRMFFVKTVVG